MGAYWWGIGLALLAAAGVVVAASSAGEGNGLRTFWDDLRSGLRSVKDRSAHDEVPDAPPVDVPFDQLFAETSQPDDGYLQLDELADVIERTGERASRLLPGRAGERLHHDAVPAPRAATPRPPHAPHVPRAHAPRRSGHVPAAVAHAGPPSAVPPRGHDG